LSSLAEIAERYRMMGLEPTTDEVGLAALLRDSLMAQAEQLTAADVVRFPFEPVDPSRAPDL
jgi:hypothetical protein